MHNWDTTNYTEHEPIDLSEVVKQNFRKSSDASFNILDVVTKIHKGIVAHGNISTDDLVYADRLYPRLMAETLLLSRTTTQHWPFRNHPNQQFLDLVLEKLLGQWVRSNVTDQREYMRNLLLAIQHEKCINGMLCRLNLHIVAQPTRGKIEITTSRFKAVHVERLERDAATGNAKELITKFLRSQKFNIVGIDAVYQQLSDIDRYYSIEKTLLSWIGFTIVRALAENQSDIRVLSIIKQP